MTLDPPGESVKAFPGDATASELALFLADEAHDITRVEVLRGMTETVILVYYRFTDQLPALRLLEGGAHGQ